MDISANRYDEVGWPEDFPAPSESNEDPFDMTPLRCSASGQTDCKAVHYLEVTLEELLNGCRKQVTISRAHHLNETEHLKRRTTFEIEVKAGSANGETYRVQQADGSEDILVHLKERPHSVFLRKGADLEVTTLLPEESHASSATFELLIPTLDGDYISLNGKANCLRPNYIHVIEGYGLPYLEEPEYGGNLLVRFIGSPSQVKTAQQHEHKPSLLKESATEKSTQKHNFPFIEKQLKKYIKRKIIPENSLERETLLPQAEPIFRELPVSLIEVLKGGIKSIDFKRNIFNVGVISTREIVQLDVNIEPGVRAGMEYCFEEYGDKIPGQRPANILFTLVDEPNCTFKRLGDVDIEHTVTISYRQAIQMEGIIELSIPTLEGDSVSLPINERITPFTVKEIPNRGLPTLGNLKKRGNLLVKFKINHLPDNMPALPQDLPIRPDAEVSFEETLEGTQVKTSFTRQKFLNDTKGKQEQVKLSDKAKLPGSLSGKEQLPPKMGHKSKLKRSSLLQQIEPILVQLPLTFTEIFTGCLKEVHFKVKHVKENGIEGEKSKQLSVPIKPGMMTGSRIIFPGEGHQLKGCPVAGDLIVITGETPGGHFTRDGANLLYKATVPPEDALDLTYQLTVPSIDDKPNPKLRLKTGQPIQVIYGRGLPYLNDGKLRGNIIVHCELTSPEAPNSSLGTLSSSSLPTIEIPLVVSLSEVLYGCNTRIEKITYSVPGSKRLEAKIFDIVIHPGTEAGERFTFPQVPDSGDPCHYSVVFIVTDEVNETFKRIDGVNLLYRQTVLTTVGETFDVPLLEPENAHSPTYATVRVTQAMMAARECLLPGAGLPYLKKVNMRSRGHLIIKLEPSTFPIGTGTGFGLPFLV